MSDNESQSTPPDTRSPMAKALDLVSQITAVSLTLVLPALGGYFLDGWLGTGLVFVILGLLLGFGLAGLQMKALVEKLNRSNSNNA